MIKQKDNGTPKTQIVLDIGYTLYEYRHKSTPFVASRAVQAMMYAYGKARFKSSSSGMVLISEFPQDIVLERFDEFIMKYPLEGETR